MTQNERISAEYISNFEAQEGYPADSLLNVMLFETAGTLRPDIRNKQSGAVGLIQFTRTTLKGLGYTADQAARMTVPEQLEILVKPYFKPYKKKILASADWLDTYMAVLWPAGIGKPDSYVMFKAPSREYRQNSGLDVDKNGQVTKGDVRRKFTAQIAAVRKKKGFPLVAQLIPAQPKQAGTNLIFALILLGTLFFRK
ncbi:MAG: hypothetical protein EBX50_16985 [Chitinophagia bacterium]|nr:hypothetical protein [Chitinophagia bacterium]